ncbi:MULTISPECIES: AbrB/MazE/SpoVT family DNA-binding domain-containing protein [Dermabacter]|uniref:AbrB/MazE/SpoVT family DNA-binding domain-containing protein n=2 Tax=Dermabacteraceae TaxID=85020 RepID=UPI0021A72E38|nr:MULTISPECIES: AbrB/MazE/SpoVT family DNA-binding domain-containing protein [Dermabacter]EFQ0233692.1 AbrB/MazE/SpoVT family DNA-binding domain-containing protein [Shigella flexneri]MCT1955311.1 AbrB/MazE/SpoVT family DNA-binding domain-containing protein [Dermabacter hominis]MCT2055714.1 AbrB/MazE/SpoVT family DNA-binding domain-containing protein [Dermabacter hominis]MCT2090633.1 AbrB/MazE/SpoVT family DNA-binding domain-containing protein [Dermabacter hominis]MCT2190720.1 AbrB/MazE/SpoVT 
MDMDQTPPPGKYAATVKVGPKGQVVIPKGARELFDIHPGDTLLLLADANQGIALMRQETLDQIVMQAAPGHQSPRGLRGDEG